MKKLALISKILIALLLAVNYAEPAAAAGNYYTVRTGDTIYAISKRNGVKHNSIMTANRLSDSRIYPGQRLVLPTAAGREIYNILPGDNLFRIARKNGVSVSAVMAANGLKTAEIHAGDRLVMPDPGVKAVPVFSKGTLFQRYTDEELILLARLIHAEARGEDHRGKVAVGAVIMNRISSGKFPAGIREVIYQKTNGVYQFTPVKDGNIKREPGEEAFRAAREALNGVDPTGGALFFYNPEKSSDRWIRTLPVTTTIGNHVFAK